MPGGLAGGGTLGLGRWLGGLSLASASSSNESGPLTPRRSGDVAAGGARGYKRSWKNLLINKRYQLRFTLFMVGMAALLMTGLGVWVMRVADEATV